CGPCGPVASGPCGSFPGYNPYGPGGFAPNSSCNRCKPYKICKKHRSCETSCSSSCHSDSSDSECESSSCSSSEKCEKKKTSCQKKNVNSDTQKCILETLLAIQQNINAKDNCCVNESNNCCNPQVNV